VLGIIRRLDGQESKDSVKSPRPCQCDAAAFSAGRHRICQEAADDLNSTLTRDVASRRRGPQKGEGGRDIDGGRCR
jgi:hypothetical protein